MTNQLEKGSAEDLRRTAAVAADYEQLQGLITATTGVGLLVWASGSSTWGAIIIALGAGVWSSYYQKRFGKAVSRGSLALTLVLIMCGLLVCLAGWAVDQVAGLPVLVLPLIASACLLATFRWGYPHVGVTRVHWVALVLLALSSLAPLVGLAGLIGLGPYTGMLFFGLAMVAIGIADHHRLVRSMKPVPHD